MNESIGFIVERALGHITHGKNLYAILSEQDSVNTLWGFPEQYEEGWRGSLPLVRNWTVQASLQSRQILRRFERQGPLGAVFFHTQITAMLAQDFLRRIPSVVSLDATPLQYDMFGEFYDHAADNGRLETLKRNLAKRCFRHAKRLVAWSSWTKNGLVQEYDVPEEKVSVISPGVNVAAWRLPEPRQFDPDVVKILFVGGNFERKGGLDLLAAFRQLRLELQAKHSRYDIELHIVTRDAVTPEENVFVYHNVPPNSEQLKQLNHQCDLFCLPTYGDYLPLVITEAAATRMPSISTDITGISEIVTDQKTGFLLEPGDVRGLKEALAKLVTDPHLRQAYGDEAFELVSRKHDVRTNAFRVLDLMREVAQNGAESDVRVLA